MPRVPKYERQRKKIRQQETATAPQVPRTVNCCASLAEALRVGMLQGHVAKTHRETIPTDLLGSFRASKPMIFWVKWKLSTKSRMALVHEIVMPIPFLFQIWVRQVIQSQGAKGYCLVNCSYPLLPFSCFISVLLLLRISQLSEKMMFPSSPQTCDVFPLQASQARLGQSSSLPVPWEDPAVSVVSRSANAWSIQESKSPMENCLFCLCFVYVSW